MLAATMRRVVTPSVFLPSSLFLPPIVIRLVQVTTRSLSRGDRLQVQPAATMALGWRRGIARPYGRLEFGHERKCETQRRSSLLAALPGLE